MPVPVPPAPQNVVTITAYGLIKGALRLIGASTADEEVPIEEAGDGLNTLNQMLDAWNADRLMVYTISSQDFPFVVGKQAYTLGSGGDFDMTRPVRISGMSSILLANPDNRIEVPITMYNTRDWQLKMPVKQVDGSFPQICYDDGSFPLRVLNFWPIPQQQNDVRIYSWQPLLLLDSLKTNITLPQAYARALRFNLAIDLAPEYDKEPSATVVARAKESLSLIRTINQPEMELRSDLIATEPGYNYKADLFGIPF